MKTKMGQYLCEFAPNNPRATREGYVYSHVLAAEKKLGRLLNPEECVHHLDENKHNNELDNLIVFKTKADHAAFHKGVEKVLDGDVWCCPSKRIDNKELCPVCNTNYKDENAEMCIDCWSKLNRGFIKDTNIPLPSREVLKDKIRTSSFVQISKEYNISDNAVRKWCKFYGLPFKSSIIRTLSDYEWENELF